LVLLVAGRDPVDVLDDFLLLLVRQLLVLPILQNLIQVRVLPFFNKCTGQDWRGLSVLDFIGVLLQSAYHKGGLVISLLDGLVPSMEHGPGGIEVGVVLGILKLQVLHMQIWTLDRLLLLGGS